VLKKDISYCSLPNRCDTNSSICLELPFTAKLNTNIPYLCLCSNSTVGYPYCFKKVNYLQEIGSQGALFFFVFFYLLKIFFE
jgi:hypothetical protein